MNTKVERALLDDEQGVDMDGHDCWLVLTPNGQWLRGCLVPHDDLDGECYRGMPLGREGLTHLDLGRATVAGAEDSLIEWLASEVDDRLWTAAHPD